MKKKLITWSNATTVALALLMIVLFISPQAKALMIEGLMKVGFFKPSVENTEPKKTTNGEVNLAPSLLLKRSDGKSFDIKDQKGKVLFINFWATCVSALHRRNAVYQRNVFPV